MSHSPKAPRPTKQLTEGMLVTYKRGWIVPCGKGDVLRGVWRRGGFIRMGNGTRIEIPAGVQVEGHCQVLGRQG